MGGADRPGSAPARARALRTALVALLCVLLVACTPQGGGSSTSTPAADRDTVAAASTTIVITTGGVERRFTLRSPAHAPGEVLPVVVGLHGAGGNAATFEKATGLSNNIAVLRYIAVFPDGTSFDGDHRAWNAGTCCAVTALGNVDDVGFVAAMLDVIVADHDADPRRLYLAGFSNGGMLAYRVACELGSRVAGIAVVGGALNVSSCVSPEPVPLLIVHGTSDQVVPFDGGVPRVPLADGMSPWQNASVSTAVETWTSRNGCGATSQLTTDGTVRRRLYTGCAAGSFVDVYDIVGGGHSWPIGHGSLDTTDTVLTRFIGSR